MSNKNSETSIRIDSPMQLMHVPGSPFYNPFKAESKRKWDRKKSRRN